MKDYIYELLKVGKVSEMERDFELTFPTTKVKLQVLLTQKDMRIVVVARKDFHLIKTFIANDFNCYPEKNIHSEYKSLPKSDSAISDELVRKWYLTYMKNAFPTYKEDFLENAKQEAEKDIGL